MDTGVIIKALSGFYYVRRGDEVFACRARGKFRRRGLSPLVGDRVAFTPLTAGEGVLEEILPRKNEFRRPAVSNVDQLVLVVSQALPVTDPFLIDRITVIAAMRGCACVVCVNKCDLDPGEELWGIYSRAGFPTVRVSAATGEGMEALRRLLDGKVSAFTGNSGVGKSSILNALHPGFALQTGQVSEKLGRGRHTTRHVELFALEGGALIADTPGFSSFDEEGELLCPKEELSGYFPEFAPYAGRCRFPDCSHRREAGCAVAAAEREGLIEPTRRASYIRLYEQAAAVPDWERKKAGEP